MKKFDIKEDDVINIDKYINERPKIKKEISEIKKFRRIPVGPYATFYFECYDEEPNLHRYNILRDFEDLVLGQ